VRRPDHEAPDLGEHATTVKSAHVRSFPGDELCYLEELFVNIRRRQQYLWRAVDEDGDVIGILMQARRDRHAAARFFRKLLKGQGTVARRLTTDKLRSYAAAHRP